MIKIILIAVLAVTTLGFMGATIGLAVTRNDGKSTSKQTPPTVPLCNNVPGYVASFIGIEEITEQYIYAMEDIDSALLTSMMSEGKPFEDGKLIFERQADVIAGAIDAANHLGKDCENPGLIPREITDRYTLADDYSKMTYRQFLASQGITS